MVGSAFNTTQCSYNAGGNIIIITSGTNISPAASSDWRRANGKETIRSDADDSGQSNDGLQVTTCGLEPRLNVTNYSAEDTQIKTAFDGHYF